MTMVRLVPVRVVDSNDRLADCREDPDNWGYDGDPGLYFGFPVVYECTGYTQFWRKVREMVPVKPAGALNLNTIRGNFPAIIIGNKPEHE
jgi:hypothetical protein